ncbi:GH92 family glycosyl hydrolase [Streptomyces sp. SLBN-118]|uniref:GH92 family glycosyl hydrolase n=1 Tax=Streptomyces sp. SLBN-118 TaxID=2768454 RepID=UPI001C92ECF4|nr:GH92 family glycosyl hydrolase [Streptomyces sp. SLBN-118]
MALLAAALTVVTATPAVAGSGDFSSGFESGDPQPTWLDTVAISQNIGGFCCGLTAMQSSPRTEQAHTGSSALMYSGNDQSDDSSYSYNKVFDVDIPVGATSTLSYWVYPQGKHLDVAVDMAFTDGTWLRDSGAVDQYGVPLHPRYQGQGGKLQFDQWNHITSAIGDKNAGKTIDRILIGYDHPAQTGTFRGFFDDIEIKAAGAVPAKRLSDYVDTRRGSNSTPDFSRGNTFPGSTVPNGFNFWTPITEGNSDSWLYKYGSSTVQGFGISHEPSPWIGDYGQLQVMPMTGSVDSAKSTPDARKSTFSHANEVAKAHYYKTRLDTSDIMAEMTPTDHAGVMRFWYPGGTDKASAILFDTVDSATGSINIDTAARTISGDIVQHGQKVYFYATVDRAIAASGSISGQGVTSWIRFTDPGEVVTLKMATSFISVAQATANLNQEVGTNSFDTVKESAANLWDRELGRVQIEGASDDRLTTFYSCMYRAFMYPNNRSEMVNGVRKYMSPYDSTVHSGQMYVNNGFWDTARAVWPLYTLLTPTKTGQMLDGMANAYLNSGWTPRWTGPGYIDIMVGTNQDLAFADAYMKGVRNFDYQMAYASMVRNASTYSGSVSKGRKGIEVSTFKHYVPTDVVPESASWTLEDANNNFGIAQMGGALGFTEDAAYFKNRSLDYANLFDINANTDSTGTPGFFHGKDKAGNWRKTGSDFKPNEWGYEFTEGAPWHYAMAAPQDPQGMANLYGGRDKLSDKIDAVFSASRDYLTGSYGGTIHEMREAYETNMGQYAHSNEPIHHMLYMYNYAGKPAKTQDKVRDVLTKLYNSGAGTGNGYLGDEDNGQMSAWYIFSALGFYPARMGSLDYTIGAPLHPKATITLESGQKFTVEAPGVSDTNRYIQSATLDGVPYTKNFITHGQIAGGGKLTLTMGPTPSSWGTGASDIPPSITASNAKPQPLVDKTTGSTITVSGENAPNETKDKLVDDTSLTKWLAFQNTATLTSQLSSNTVVKQYTLTSANDYPGRDPKSWTLQGFDGINWVTLDTRTNIDFSDRRQTRAFVINNSNAYSGYRLQVTANHGAAETQLAEWELLG